MPRKARIDAAGALLYNYGNLITIVISRKARIDATGALRHIIVRGIERRKIFYDDADRDAFANRLGQVLTETHILI